MTVSAQGLDGNLTSLGPLTIITLQATLYHNYAGSWAMTVPYDAATWAMVSAPDFGVLINWNEVFTFGGKCEIPGFSNSLPGAAAATLLNEGPFIQLAGADYKALIANRIAYPDPTSAWTAQTAIGSDAVSAVACETAIKHYVTANAGSLAIPARQVPLLTVAPDLAQGGTVSYNVQFSSNADFALMDIIRSLVATGGPMGVSVENNGTGGLVFDVYVPRDLSDVAWFSADLGNLTTVDLQVADPTLTNALVRGKSVFTEVTGAGSADYWTHIEELIDQTGETSSVQVTQAGTAAIKSGIASPLLAVTVQDLPRLSFGTDYGLGDLVTVEIEPGDTYTDIVSQVDFNIDMTATPPMTVIPTIGVPADSGSADASLTRQLTRRVRRLERLLNSEMS